MSDLLKTEWTHWNELPCLSQNDSNALLLRWFDRISAAALRLSSCGEFLQTQLPELATELSVQFTAVVRRTPEWETAASFGRHPFQELPLRFLEDVLDRDAAGRIEMDEVAGWSVMAVSIGGKNAAPEILVCAGRAVPTDGFHTMVAAARAFSHGLRLCERAEANEHCINRLQRTLELASKFAGLSETQPLLEMIAEEATHLLACDRASIFIWDRPHKEVVACPALGVPGGTLRLADNVGVVGQVIQTGQLIRVDDAYTDKRFEQSVDRDSGYTTRNLLCVPLLDGDGKLIGAFEAMNKKSGVFNDSDAESLRQLGVQAAIALQNVREREQLVRSREQLTEQVREGVRIIGESPAIVAMRATIDRLAQTDLPVLILGESGTGKEVVSQALHYQGSRADHPFVAVNCAALTETLLESELFGHEKGAFTDAHDMRQGKFELADNGTLFLDEIGDMSLGGQAKLLRVLEQKVITRVGGAQAIPINVRIVAATNSNLADAVRAKSFREDLYYRLSVVTLDLPPLRDRPEDILQLAEYFLKRFSVQARRPRLQLSTDARRRLQAHGWPGNVRELRNLMERVCFLTTGDQVEADDLAFILSPDRDSAIDMSADHGLGEATKRFQQEFIRRSINRVQGNMSEAAKLLGLHRSNLYRKMRQLDMTEAGDEEL